MIRLLLVEDSAVQREFLRFILEDSGEFEIVATAVDGEDAVRQAELVRPDVILMDCHMPKLDGIGATRIIMETCPAPIVVASASALQGEQQLTFDAIKNGALAVVNKPPAFGSPEYDRIAGQLVRTLRLMSEVKVVRRWRARSSARADRVDVVPAPPDQAVHVVALVGSTGAPGVIAEILTAVGPATRAPVLIVQHMAEGFVEGFASWLAARTGMPARMARDGERVESGCAYLAPDNAQMGIDASGRIVLSDDADDDGFRPSGSHLLRSVARAYGPKAMGVLLTGMGRDGVAGLLDLRQAGGVTIAQSEESCVVFGMPGEAVRLGAATHVLPPDEIERLIAASTVT